MNPWHDVEIGKGAPEVINVIIEIPKDSMNKYEIDKKTGLLKLDRVLFSPVHYPGNYGLIPQTYWDDKDPLDVLVLGTTSIHPLTIVKVKPIGIMSMIDNLHADDKIIAVQEKDPRFEMYNDANDLPKHMIKEIKHFFKIYKQLQDALVKVIEVKGKDAALEAVKKGVELYKEYMEKNKTIK